MNVSRLVRGAAAAAVSVAAFGAFASPAIADDSTTVTLDLAGMTSPSCPAQLPLANTIALPSGAKVVFAKGLLSTVTTLASQETVTVSPLDSSGKAGTPLVKDQAVPLTSPLALADGSYKLDWKALNLLGAVQGTQTGTLILAPNATSRCDLAVSLPTPQVSVSALNPVLSPVNSAVNGLIGAVNQAVSPVSSVVNQVTAVIPGVSPAKSVIPTQVPTSGFNFTPWNSGPYGSVVPSGYGNGPGVAYTYVPPAGAPSYNLVTNLGGSSAAAASSQSIPGPTTTQSPTVDLAASKSRGLLDSLSGVFVVLAFAALSGAIAYYVRNFLRANGGKFI